MFVVLYERLVFTATTRRETGGRTEAGEGSRRLLVVYRCLGFI